MAQEALYQSSLQAEAAQQWERDMLQQAQDMQAWAHWYACDALSGACAPLS